MNVPEYAIEIIGLNKTYSSSKKRPAIEALKAVDLKIPLGSFFALLGPNGAGKSTLINILAGLVNKTSGTVKIWGFDLEMEMRSARRAIGVVPQELNIDPFFTPREVLELQAGLYGVPKASRITGKILETVGLMDKADDYARSLSGGMRRRLLVGKAMVHSPPILVLDEPSAGVDVDLRRQLWQHVKEMSKNGTTVLLTTHYLEEAEALCDTVGIINQGSLVACEPTLELLTRLDTKELIITLDDELDVIPQKLKLFNVELKDKRKLIFTYPPSDSLAGEILEALSLCKLKIKDISSKEIELEDIFVNLTRQ